MKNNSEQNCGFVCSLLRCDRCARPLQIILFMFFLKHNQPVFQSETILTASKQHRSCCWWKSITKLQTWVENHRSWFILWSDGKAYQHVCCSAWKPAKLLRVFRDTPDWLQFTSLLLKHVERINKHPRYLEKKMHDAPMLFNTCKHFLLAHALPFFHMA